MIVWRKEMIETMKIRFCKLYSRVSSPLDDLNEALEGVYNGKNVPCVTTVPTSDLCLMVLVSEMPITQEDCRSIFNRFDSLDMMSADGPFNAIVDIDFPEAGVRKKEVPQ